MFIVNRKQRKQLNAYIKHCNEKDKQIENRIEEIRHKILMNALGFKMKVNDPKGNEP